MKKNINKKDICIIIFVILIMLSITLTCLLIDSLNNSKRIYSTTMIITEINKAENIITVETNKGYVYQFATDNTNEWNINNIICVTLDNKETESILDDEIINVNNSNFMITE